MNKNILAYSIPSCAILFALSQPVIARDYQAFFDLGYTKFEETRLSARERNEYSEDSWSVGGGYFFGKKAALGPLNEFEFINRQSFVAATGTRDDYDDELFVAGEYVANSWVVSVSSSAYGDSRLAEFGLGYFISDNLRVVLSNQSFNDVGGLFDDEDSRFELDVAYEIPLQGSDYFGIYYHTDEDRMYQHVRSKYFAELSGGQYLTLSVSADIFDYDSSYQVSDNVVIAGKYFFNQYTGVGAFTEVKGDADKAYGLNASHYFNENLSISLVYEHYKHSSERTSVSQVDLETLSLTCSYQF